MQARVREKLREFHVPGFLAGFFTRDIPISSAGGNHDHDSADERLLAPFLIAVLVAAGCAQKPAPIVGAWRSSIQFEDGAFAEIHDLEFMYVFNAGGDDRVLELRQRAAGAAGLWRLA